MTIDVAELQKAAADLASKGVFLGGPPEAFSQVGSATFNTALEQGLRHDSNTLDVGCGVLRVGVFLIDYLNPGRYCGIEPNAQMLSGGISTILTDRLMKEKSPAFDSNDRFDFSVFHRSFDFVLARSIWTHASKDMITKMIQSFKETAVTGAVFLTSYLKARFPWEDYRGASWVGRSHVSAEAGTVRHDIKWIQHECHAKGLNVKEVGTPIRGQRWLRIEMS